MPKTVLRDPGIRRLRALAFLQRRLGNIPLADIAKEFNVVPITVSKELAWAKRQGLIEDYSLQILNDLVPDAIATVKTALGQGDVKAALAILTSVGLLGAKVAATPAPAGEGESLELYVRHINPGGGSHGPTITSSPILAALGAAPDEHPTAGETSSDSGSVQENLSSLTALGRLGENVIDAEVIAPSVCTGGDENRTPHQEQDLGIPADGEGLPPEPDAH